MKLFVELRGRPGDTRERERESAIPMRDKRPTTVRKAMQPGSRRFQLRRHSAVGHLSVSLASASGQVHAYIAFPPRTRTPKRSQREKGKQLTSKISFAELGAPWVSSRAGAIGHATRRRGRTASRSDDARITAGGILCPCRAGWRRRE